MFNFVADIGAQMTIDSAMLSSTTPRYQYVWGSWFTFIKKD